MSRPGSTVEIVAKKLRSGRVQIASDDVATEEPLEIRLYYMEGEVTKSQSVSITMRTPGNDFELSAGFLYTEQIISSRAEIDRISYCVDVPVEQKYNIVNIYLKAGVTFDPTKLVRHFYTTSSCGVCGKASLEALQMGGCRVLTSKAPMVSEDVCRQLPFKLREAQKVFSKTGGLHAAGLFDTSGRLIVLREDVGRHNAVDKLIGAQMLSGKMPLSDFVMQVSGRTSFEIMQKALTAGIPVVAAVGAPSSLAVDLAKQFHMTLLGFVSKDGFNIYSGEDRVALSQLAT